MWKIDLTVDEAISKWPGLKHCIPLKCECGLTLSPAEVIATADFIYLKSEQCSCKTFGPTFSGITRSKRAFQKWMGLFNL